ncbi:MAG: histidine kinase, partial [Pseudomonas sp.]
MTEVALATDTSAQPPAVILQLLEKLGVPYQVCYEQPKLALAQRVQAVLLDDAIGALLVLYPQSQLLDLNRLAELTGRKLAAVKPERQERMLAKHNLT